jgi:AbiV family abortive infection protein
MEKSVLQPMTISEVETARLKILKNAAELIEEAGLLYEKGRYARAYALSHLACEECSKVNEFIRAAAALKVGAAIDWSCLDKRLRNHESKIEYFVLELSDAWGNPDSRERLELLVQDLRKKGHYNDMKNRSLYADQHEGAYRAPSEIVSAELSLALLSKARQLFGLMQEQDHLARTMLDSLTSDPALRTIAQMYADEVSPLRQRQPSNRRKRDK